MTERQENNKEGKIITTAYKKIHKKTKVRRKGKIKSNSHTITIEVNVGVTGK